MRGASAIQEAFERVPGAHARALIIWEPMLTTDWSRPGSGVLSRARDSRATQFWDPEHLFAKELQRRMTGDPQHPQPRCCGEEEGIPWDMVLVYPAQSRWEKALPRAAFADGAVYRVTLGIEKALAEALKDARAVPAK